MAYDGFDNVWGVAKGLDQRGRHSTTESALDAALKELLVVKNPFLDTLQEKWKRLFPKTPARPGRFEAGVLYLYVPSSPALYMVRPYLRSMKAKIAALPGAPAKLEVKLMISG